MQQQLPIVNSTIKGVKNLLTKGVFMISVCMATYNGEKYIKQQLDSILPQLAENDEIVISDNDSTDNTIDIIKSYNDNRIKLLSYKCDRTKLKNKLKRDKNITNNFENSLKECKGDVIFFSDQDDIWFPNKVIDQLPLLEKYDLVMSNATLIDGNGNITRKQLYDKNPLRRGLLSFRARGCLSAVTRELVEVSLPFPKTAFSHDLWLTTLAEYRHSYYFLNKQLVYHRRGIGNASFDVTQKSTNSLAFRIYYRLELLIDGLLRYLKIR